MENEMETREYIGIIRVYSPPEVDRIFGESWDNGKEKRKLLFGFRVYSPP